MKKMDLMKFVVYLDWQKSGISKIKLKISKFRRGGVEIRNDGENKTKDTNQREQATNWLKRKNTLLRRTFDEGSLNFTIVHMFCSHHICIERNE